MPKRYYWLKLKEDFFRSKEIKKLRNQAGGDTYTIIYLKMLLLAIKTDGILKWTGIEDDFAEELALDLDEKPDDVRVTLAYLLKIGFAEIVDNVTFFLPHVLENTGSEGSSAQRVRDFRARQKSLQCNESETEVRYIGNGEIEKEIEKKKEIEKEYNTDNQPSQQINKKRFIPPTVEEVTEYCNARNNSISPQLFVDHYTSTGWRIGKNGMKDWKAAVRTWEGRENDGKHNHHGYKDQEIPGVTRL